MERMRLPSQQRENGEACGCACVRIRDAIVIFSRGSACNNTRAARCPADIDNVM